MCYTICPITCARLSDYSANCSDTFTHKHSHTPEPTGPPAHVSHAFVDVYVHGRILCSQPKLSGNTPRGCRSSYDATGAEGSEGSAGVKVDSKLALSCGVGLTKGAEGGSLSRCVLMIQAFLQYCLNRTVNTGPSPVEGSHLLLFVLKFTSQL